MNADMTDMEVSFWNRTARGFSMGEVLIASFVLTAGLLAVAALIASSHRQALLARDTIIATELAQEGIELVRNIRDNNIASDPSNPFIGFPGPGTPHCRMDHDDTAMSCSTAANSAFNNPSLYALEYVAGGTYEHTGSAGAFHRYIYIDYNGTDAALVRSFVFQDPASYAPSVTGDASGCTASNRCAYTEISLTNWK